jgi:hypothetical protein
MAIHLNQIPKEVRDRLGLKAPPAYKQFWAQVGDKQPIYFRSEWEFYYSLFLEKLKKENKIIDWKHEPKCFWFNDIKRGVRSYLPDFCVTHKDGSEEWSEVKGFFDSRSQTKMKRMAKYYPEVKIRLVGADWFKQNLKACKALQPLLSKRVEKAP